MGYKRKEAPPQLEPLGISVQETARLTSASVSTVWTWIKTRQVESVLLNGRRVVIYASVKKMIVADKVRKIRVGVHNPKNGTTQTAA